MFITEHKKIFLAIGIALLVVSFGIVLTLGLRFGIDFTGGSLMEVAYDARPDKATIEDGLNQLELGDYSLREAVTEAGRDGYLLRTKDLTDDLRAQVESVLLADSQNGTVERFTSVGPVIGQELKDKAVWAIGAVVIVIVLYLAFAFAGVGRPVSSWAYGTITILALAHDVFVPTAVISLLGYFAGVEIDVLFVMALLAVLGYSVNDTIVVFDRVRENLVKYRNEKKVKGRDQFNQPIERIEYTFNKPFPEVVGEALTQSMTRSVNTSLTTLLSLVALYFIGGQVTQVFALMLIVGVVAGTYSSIFLACPMLLWWAERNQTAS